LDLSDLRQINGIWCFDIWAEYGDDKSVKTEGSDRVVPVHPKLLEIGLIEHRVKMKEAGETKLFPGIEQDARGFWSGEPSKFLNKYLRQIRVKTDRTLNVHSFRHSAADAFRRAGYRNEQFAMLLGHTRASMTRNYGDYGRDGNISPEDLSMRAMMINAVKYEGLQMPV
jgi:integrase